MNNNLTIKGQSANLNYSDEKGSLRTFATSPLAGGHKVTLTIAHQPYIDSATKAPGVRSVMRFQAEAYHVGTGQKLIPFAQLTLGRPSDKITVTDADFLVLVDSLRQMIASTSADASSLNLAGAFATVNEQ